ncbi:MAG: MBOAT family protein [Muribaculaceae bacterium]|nr:MBOAT family protein [Muribaculaceae bacterium]
MLFNSTVFYVFFILVFIAYWMLPKKTKWQNLFLIATSYVFYGWWDWRFTSLLLFITVFSYFCGIRLDKAESLHAKKWICTAEIVVSFLILAIFKYLNFFADNFCELMRMFGFTADNVTLHLILPIGISFYTFQTVGYVIDVYRGKVPAERNFITYAAFVSFFPQLISGPIGRAPQLMPQFSNARKFDYATAVDGARQILWGLFKKVVVADNCSTVVGQIFAPSSISHEPGLDLLIGALLFTIQIYGDFSGYSDIALGTAKMLNIRLMRNFNVPYFSRNVSEFWRRWHISLSTWFRDYIYIPLGGNRRGKAITILNTFIVFGTCGLWHGANWTFICWGLYYAVLMTPLILLGSKNKHKGVPPSAKDWLSILGTFILVMFGWVLFKAESIGQAVEYVTHIFTNISMAPTLDLYVTTLLFIVIMFVFEWWQRTKEHPMEINGWPMLLRWSIYSFLILTVVFFKTNSKEFIYFQF